MYRDLQCSELRLHLKRLVTFSSKSHQISILPTRNVNFTFGREREGEGVGLAALTFLCDQGSCSSKFKTCEN